MPLDIVYFFNSLYVPIGSICNVDMLDHSRVLGMISIGCVLLQQFWKQYHVVVAWLLVKGVIDGIKVVIQ